MHNKNNQDKLTRTVLTEKNIPIFSGLQILAFKYRQLGASSFVADYMIRNLLKTEQSGI